ncbi:uncharacterized mitochondrial protein AtMg00820-like [Carya illinoinensis]|uniref:uncharacterized mitochondrial protein AtMg00820-like n=1 Tax=Carya illinoinensis TaxID=32201 RepID=UPI001C71977E|nr:uncharacterized mitochondrial protein AtMg00820-like [Carya illinoinensis]
MSIAHNSFVISITCQSKPKNYQEAKNYPEWCTVIRVEIEALELDDTWVLVDLPPYKEAIGYKWVYKVNFNVDGSVEGFKARLVAKGYIQQEGLDYHETFSPVAKSVTMRTLLAVTTIKGWNLYQFDVNNAFLHGYTQSKADYNLFTKKSNNSFTTILVYVDDIIVADDCIDTINHLKASLHDKFRIKDLEKLKYFLGLR